MKTIEFYPTPFWVGVILLILILSIVALKTRSFTRVFFSGILGIYLLVLIGLTLFPIYRASFHIGMPSASLLKAVEHKINLVPFSYGVELAKNGLLLTYHILGNTLATVPFGFLLPLAAPRLKRRILWLAIGLGVCVELSQLGFMLLFRAAYRSVDVNDVIWNTIGALAGYGIYRGAAWMGGKVRKRIGANDKKADAVRMN